MALTLTVQASQVKAQEYHRQQGWGLQNRPLWPGRKWLTHWQYKGSLICGATQETESGKIQEELDDPCMWWDKRAKYWTNYPDFKHASTGESLWIGSPYYPKWVHLRLKCLEGLGPALGQGIRAQYRRCEGPNSQRGSTSYLETKLKEKGGRETFRTCNEMKVKTMLTALKASTSSRNLERGKKIHVDAIESGDDSNIYVANSLINMYAKCGSMGDARGVFDSMMRHDVVSWTALMLGYTENGEAELALQLFARMRFEGCAPDSRTFVAVLKACTSLAAKEEGKLVDGKLVKMGSLKMGMAIHSQASKSDCDSDIYVGSSLVDMYAKCGSMTDALGVFDRMPSHNVVAWNALILGYAENGEGDLALELFANIQSKPNRVTFLAAVKACASLAAKEDAKQVDRKLMKLASLEKGMTLHSQAAKSGFDADTFVASSLVDMYAECGSLVDARGVFDRMPSHDVVSWNAIILGYAENGEAEVALQLVACMQRQGCAPNARTFVAALKACGSVGALEIGKAFHADICRCGHESNAVIANCLVDFYGKCGSMGFAQQVFDSIARRGIMTWNALIAGYCRQGDTSYVFDLFQRMRDEGVQPNGITFLSILTACSHAGLIDKGKEYFQAMWSKYEINPGLEHYTCIIDILGRANQLDEAVAMVKTMCFKPDVVTWTTVLGACQKWKNVVVGRLAFDSLLRLDEKQSAAYVLMANIYGSVGMWEEKSKVHAMRRKAGARTKLVDR